MLGAQDHMLVSSASKDTCLTQNWLLALLEGLAL